MLFLILLSTIVLVSGTTFTRPVNTTQGLIRGVFAEDGNYSMYLGVPYAKVNKANPFGVSIPHPRFDSIFDADDDTNVCPQQEEFNKTIVGTLDCLNLNVYVPNKSSLKTKLPVLVYLYGGRFTFGFSRRFLNGPQFLVEHDIILVLINYRVGPYGFMCLDIQHVPGNQGLKDQYLALSWIYENIESFGGDVNRITLSGNSAGAMSVDFHLLNDQPKFYTQAILQSGSAFTPEILLPQDNVIPIKIAKYLGYTINDLEEAISVLANTDTDLVIGASLELEIKFRPCVEKKFDKVVPFIDTYPEHTNISNLRDIKIIAGFTSHERYSYNIEETMFADVIQQSFNIQDMDNMINKVKRFYIGDGMITQKELYPDLITFVSDFNFNYPIQRCVVRYIRNGLQVYHYVFSYSGSRNFVKRRLNITIDGATHADELGYLFNIGFFSETPTFEDQVMIDRMTTMWTNFVKFGNPTPSTSDLIPVTWVPATSDLLSYLEINSELVMKSRPFHARLSFWDLFYAANQDNLLANINCDPSSTASSLSVSLLLVSVCSVAKYLLQL